jgi:hypothetical protein
MDCSNIVFYCSNLFNCPVPLGLKMDDTLKKNLKAIVKALQDESERLYQSSVDHGHHCYQMGKLGGNDLDRGIITCNLDRLIADVGLIAEQ